jgi:hypothetical protein
VFRVSYDDLTCVGSALVRPTKLYPFHFPLLVLFGRSWERYLVHCGQRYSVGVVATKNKGMGIGTGLIFSRTSRTGTHGGDLDATDNDLPAFPDNGLELDDGSVIGHWS